MRLIPENENPTRNDIDSYIHKILATSATSATSEAATALNDVVREIQSKRGVGASLHPAEAYFEERSSLLLLLLL
jgi:hypothetical protein